jgi:myosin-18
MLNVPLVRSQIRGAEIVDAVRLYRQGFPEHMKFAEFRRRFEILVAPTARLTSGPTVDEKLAAEQLLESLEVDSTSYRLGLSQLFFRAGALARLEDMRDEKLTDWVIRLQSISRGFLGRKYCQKLKLQHIAAACLQRNIRKLMHIREWHWWRLYTKVKPLLNVHRTEEELRDRECELDQLKQKLEKTEKERNEYKQLADRLETKLSELAADYQDEHSTSTQAAEMLETETAERIRLEKELKDFQTKFNQLQQLHQRTEMELIDTRMLTASIEHELDDEESDEAESALRERFERSRQEAEFAKKKLKQQHEEEIEEYEAAKKVLERKLTEYIAENEEQSRQCANLRRKLQRLNQDTADVRLHLEEQLARNGELEKKQRKFDSELAKLNESLRTEKLQRDKLQRERDDALAQKYSVDQELKGLKMDLELQMEKVQRLEHELQDMTLSDKDDKELLKLRQSKNELERKVQDQEEELDEQAGTIQQLEQAKLKLEMAHEKLRQQHAKELEEKEHDVEAAKLSAQKKVKTIEIQLEEEHEEKQKLQREKRELERRIQTLTEQKPARDKDIEHMLRRDLRRTKALLQDAQLMLQRNKDSAGSRTTVKQLRNQLEDAELATAASIKAKKALEIELQDLHQQLDAAARTKQEVEEKCQHLSRDKNELQSRIEENDEELAELMKKYKAAVQQHSVDLITFDDQSKQIETLLREKESLAEQLASAHSRLDYLQNSTVDREAMTRLEAKIRDLEAKLDLELTTRQRAETQLSRLKEQFDQETEDRHSAMADDSRVQEQIRRLQRQVRELEEELTELRLKEAESTQRRLDLERKYESLETEYEQSQSDLQLAFKRISDLQATIEDDLAADSDIDDGHSSSQGDDSDYGPVGDSDNDDVSDDDELTSSRRPAAVQRKVSVPFD